MREFHNQIEIAPINEVDVAVAQTVILKAGASWIKADANSEVLPTDKAKTKSAGRSYQQKLSVPIEKLSDADKAKLPPGMKAIVRLHDDNGELIWGDLNIPCIIKLSPNINSDSLEITRTALSPLL